MRTISPYLITKLYTWTVNDINKIFDRCFVFNHSEGRLDGPSSTFAILLATLMETWGSIMKDEFGQYRRGEVTKNINHVIELLYKRDPLNYEVFDTSSNKIKKDLAELFRHNLIHTLGKNPKSTSFDLNIDCSGKTINPQNNGRWHINCKSLKEDFLNLLRIELPRMLADTQITHPRSQTSPARY